MAFEQFAGINNILKSTTTPTTPTYKGGNLDLKLNGSNLANVLSARDLSSQDSPVTLGKPILASKTGNTPVPKEDIADVTKWRDSSLIKSLKDPKYNTISTLGGEISGGAYIKPVGNLAVKSARTEGPEGAVERSMARDNLDSRYYQVDHIVPLEFGGANTPENMQVIHIVDHDKKTAVQTVLRKLVGDGKISMNEAIAQSINWKNKNVDDIDLAKLDEFNNLPDGEEGSKIAEKKWKEWNSAPKVTVKSFCLSSVVDFGRLVFVSFFGE